MTNTPIEHLLLQYGNLIDQIVSERIGDAASGLSNAFKNASDKDVFAHALIAELICVKARTFHSRVSEGRDRSR